MFDGGMAYVADRVGWFNFRFDAQCLATTVGIGVTLSTVFVASSVG